MKRRKSYRKVGSGVVGVEVVGSWREIVAR
jgi:hypothetical protein